MRLRTKSGLLAALLLGAAAFTVWPGCASPPFFPDRKPISSIGKKDVALLKSERATRAQMLSKLGGPEADYPDIRVVAYPINELTRRRIWLFLGVLPIAVVREPSEIEYVVIQFDTNDQVQRFGIISTYYQIQRSGFYSIYKKTELRRAVEEWTQGKKPTNKAEPFIPPKWQPS